jgi:hydroxymethylglutaryl-CoA lyase
MFRDSLTINGSASAPQVYRYFSMILDEIPDTSVHIAHGYDVDRVLWLGRQVERTVGHRLRSEAVINGRTLKEGHPKFARPGLKKLKDKLGEAPGQKVPVDWGKQAKLPERFKKK